MLELFWTLVHRTAATVCALAATRVRRDQPAAHPSHIASPAEPAPLSVPERWARATGIVTAAVAGFSRIDSLQAAAASQIDAADYSLQQLLVELSTAMPILPADGSVLRALLASVGEQEADPEARTLAA